MDDERIIELYFQRHEDAVSETAKKYGSYCYSIAHRILQDPADAEESVNDTYLACWKAIPPTVPNSFSAFIGRITRRISINRFLAERTVKRGGSEPDLALEELAGCLPASGDPEATLEEKELVRILNQFLRALPDTDRRIFILRYWYLLPIADISQRFGFTQSKVKSMLMRTRKKLKTLLEKEEYFV